MCPMMMTGYIAIQQYFDKKRALVTSVAETFSHTAVFIWPLVFRTVLDVYGMRGAYLILGKSMELS